MTIRPQEVESRWKAIRGKPECSLSLTPESVRSYLALFSEAELVAERIKESLIQLASYRVKERGFRSEVPSGPGDLATSEGLEAFLVPAVEGALVFSDVIEGIPAGKERQDFIDAIVKDTNELLVRWENGQFSGKPYAEEGDIIKALDEKRQAKLDVLNITESA